ncbi:cancer-associated gene 1 protein isoform X9 [Muntiacus reevesi]|uniref:cancer-associated gene 1 protein isoform X9 n=1 Tax=Muntiacus reevesi TaxID=9886 RepID=UPI0033073D14
MDPGNVNIGNYSQNVLTQPIDTSISSLRKFEPLCQFHQTESFNNEIAVQDLTESLSYTEEPELQHYVCDYAEDTNIQEDSFKEENPMGTSTFTHTDHFALECVRQPSRSPPLIHCSEETLKFMEMPLANSNATESALNPSQSQDFLCEEEVPSDVEQPFYKENLRANYGTEEDAKMTHSNLSPNHSPREEGSANPPDMKRTSQPTSRSLSLLDLMVELLPQQDIINRDAEHFKENEKVSDIMPHKLKSFHLKKKILDKELLKHKDKIAAFRELLANEKSFQHQVPQESEHIGSEHKYVSSQATEFDSKEAKNVRDVPVVLGARLNQYHSLNEELDFLIEKLENLLETKEDHCNRLTEENDKYQRQLGNLINKVTSYEEIIKCADQRLVISHSRIAHLEERNKQLEDLIRRSRERVRRPRPRSQLKLLAVMPVILEGNRNDLD